MVADLVGLAYVMRGKDDDLLDLPEVQARLAQPPDQQTTHPETGTCRVLFDFPDLSLSPAGPHTRVIVATHQATSAKAPVGTTCGEVVYELFYTARPSTAFTPADVVALYEAAGAFETVLADENKEQDEDSLVLAHGLGSGVLAYPRTVDLEPPSGTGPCTPSHTYAHNRVCSGIGG